MPAALPHYTPEQFVQIFRRIIKAVADTFEVNEKEVVCRSLVKRIVEARSVAMVMMREFSSASLEEVGLCFGCVHSGVCQAQRRVSDRCETDAGFARRVAAVRKALGATQDLAAGASSKAPDWDQWLESEDGKRAANPMTLGPADKAGWYLENRLSSAFRAGVAYGEQMGRAA